MPPPRTLLAIEAWAHLNWPTLRRPVKPACYHLTLAFLGNVNTVRHNRLIDALESIDADAFTLVLDDTGYFLSSKVLWIGSRSVPEEAVSLARGCCNAAGQAGIRTDKRQWHAHLTLARRVSPPPPPPLLPPDFTMSFDRFGLYESILATEGARYRLMRDWTLSQ